MTTTMAPLDFDALARRYDAWYATPIGSWADRYETEALFALLALYAGECLLDLGVGTGRHAALAVGRGGRVVGVDAAAGMLAAAAARLAGQPAALVRADAAWLPFRDGAFDTVLMVTSLCFAGDPEPVLAEAARVLRPGGRLVLGELNRWSLWALLRRVEGLIRPTTYRAAHFRGIGELRGLLAATGLVPMRWEGALYLPPINRAGFLRAFTPVERLGQRYLPALGAFLAIEARKPDAQP